MRGGYSVRRVPGQSQGSPGQTPSPFRGVSRPAVSPWLNLCPRFGRKFTLRTLQRLCLRQLPIGRTRRRQAAGVLIPCAPATLYSYEGYEAAVPLLALFPGRLGSSRSAVTRRMSSREGRSVGPRRRLAGRSLRRRTRHEA